MEIYNAVFTNNWLIENSDITRVIDNEALYSVCFKQFKIAEPSISDFNKTIADHMIDSSSMFRFPNKNHCDLRKLSVIMTPFPRLHFFTCSARTTIENSDVESFIRNLFDSKNLLCTVTNKDFLHLANAFTIRSHRVGTQLASKINSYRHENNIAFSKFISEHQHIAYCHPSKSQTEPMTGIFLSNGK